jgi:TRAP-type mannitol/chloroaromatic compound transport system permease small subunit
MQALLALSNGIDAVSRKFGQVASYLVLFCALISAGNAIVRYLFSMSSNGWLEIQWYMFAGIVLLGASQTLKMNAHIRVDLVYGMLGPRARLWVDIIGLVLFLFPVTILFTYLCWPFFYQSFVGDEQSLNAGGLTRWPAKILLVIGFAMLAVQGLSELIKRIAALQGLSQIDTSYEKPMQ